MMVGGVADRLMQCGSGRGKQRHA